MPGYVDLHDHSLPGVDDGAKAQAESIEMLQRLQALGFSRVTCTPHVRRGWWDNEREHLEPVFEGLCAAVAEELPGMELRLGAENFMEGWFFERLDAGELIPLGEGGHVLVELPHGETPAQLEQLLFRTHLAGHTPVLAHPERYHDLMKDLKRLQALRNRGVLMQVSLTSLGGKFGWWTRKCAQKLLAKGLCDLVATDVHSPEGVTEYVEPGLRRLRKLVGDQQTEELLGRAPGRVLGP
jgi:protein-tyrosine phosphatase